MFSILSRCGLIAWMGAIIAMGRPTLFAAAPNTAPTTAPSKLYDRLVASYFAGKWDEVSADIAAHVKDVGGLPPAEKADVDYIRKTMAECRPAWWKTTKAGATVRFRPVVWGQALNATYELETNADPEHKRNIQINFANGAASVIVRWIAKDMDDPAIVGELPFTKGEAADYNLWNTLGTAESWINVPLRTQANLDDQGRQILTRYLDFRGSLASAYYTTPRARRLVLWTAISGWSHEYDKLPNRISRRTLGILLNEEVMAHPEIYTTLPRPKLPEVANAESSMVWEIQEYLRNHDLSLAEEKSFREAVKAFAALNEIKVRTTQKAMLPNGLAFSLDPDADKAMEAQRDAWIKAQYAGKKSQIPSSKSPRKVE